LIVVVVVEILEFEMLVVVELDIVELFEPKQNETSNREAKPSIENNKH
jgi:hypothetical protein